MAYSGEGQVRGPKATATSAFHRVTGSGAGSTSTDKQITSTDTTPRNTSNQRMSNSPPFPQPTHSSLLHETNKPNTNLGVMAAASASHNSRQPIENISPTHSGELPTEDEVDSPTPSSTASEPITDQFFPSPKSNQRSTNHRIKDNLLLKSSHLQKFATEDGRTTDEEDLEGIRDDAFAWPTHSTYDEQR